MSHAPRAVPGSYEMKKALREIPNTIWCRSLLRRSGEFGHDRDMIDSASADDMHAPRRTPTVDASSTIDIAAKP